MPSSNSNDWRSDIPRNLQLVRNSDGSQVPESAILALENALNQIWALLRAYPDTYLMSDDEFAVFNRYRSRYEQGQDAIINKDATARYWDNRHGKNGGQ